MNGKPTLTLTIAVAVRYAKGKRGRHGIENLGYVVGGPCAEPVPGVLDLPSTVLDRTVLQDAQLGETLDEHEEPGDPISTLLSLSC